MNNLSLPNESSISITNKERKLISEKFIIEIKREDTQERLRIIDIDKYADYLSKQFNEQGGAPFVIIRPIAPNKNKQDRKNITFVKDGEYNVLYGRFKKVDMHGNIQWNRIDIDTQLQLDLNKRDDLKIWIIVRMHSSIKNSPFEFHPTYYIYDPYEEARSIGQKAKEYIKSVTIINGLEGKQLASFARYLGIEPYNNSTEDIVRGLLIKKAETSPIVFNNLFKAKNRAINEIVTNAITLQIMTETTDRGYQYKGVSMGLTKEDVCEFLKKEPQFMPQLSKDIFESDPVSQNLEKEKNKRRPESKDNKSSTDKAVEILNS